MHNARRAMLFGFACFLFAFACGGGTSTLTTVRSPTGSGAVSFEVENNTDVAINNLYLAPTAQVKQADPKHLEPGTQEEIRVWGEDVLDRGVLEEGGRQQVEVPEAGRWDVRALDKHGRYQHVAGLKLGGGGRYILVLEEGGWRNIQP